MSLQEKMKQELASKKIFEHAKPYAYQYIDSLDSMNVLLQKEALNLLIHFDEPLNVESTPSKKLLHLLHLFGSPNNTTQTGVRYFGFVNEGAVPVALAGKIIS